MAGIKELLRTVNSVNRKISRIEAMDGATVDSSLFNERVSAENELSNTLLEGRLDNPVLDYCFKHFPASSVRSGSAFDIVPAVKSFMSYVDTHKGERILSINGKIPYETGIISGHAYFETVETFRYLRIPIEQLFVNRSGSWQKGRPEWNKTKKRTEQNDNRFHVNPDIFGYPGFSAVKGVWMSDMSGQTYVGSHGGPENTTVCVGDENVRNALKDGYEQVVPELIRKVILGVPD